MANEAANYQDTIRVMSEEFALQYARLRAKERGYSTYRIVYKEFSIPANETLNIQAYNELWFITYIGWGLIVKSDYGAYDKQDVQSVRETAHEHSDAIEIINTKDYQRTIRFLQVILKTEDNGIKN